MLGVSGFISIVNYIYIPGPELKLAWHTDSNEMKGKVRWKELEDSLEIEERKRKKKNEI